MKDQQEELSKSEEYVFDLLAYIHGADEAPKDEITYCRQNNIKYLIRVLGWVILTLIGYSLFFFMNSEAQNTPFKVHVFLAFGLIAVVFFLSFMDMINSYNIKKISFDPEKLTILKGKKELLIPWDNIAKASFFEDKNNLWSLKLKDKFWPIKFNFTGFSINDEVDATTIIGLCLLKKCKIKKINHGPIGMIPDELFEECQKKYRFKMKRYFE